MPGQSKKHRGNRKNKIEHVYVKFGKWLQAGRATHGLTGTELGEMVGLSRATISLIEKGKQRIMLHDVARFMKVFKCDIARVSKMLFKEDKV